MERVSGSFGLTIGVASALDGGEPTPDRRQILILLNRNDVGNSSRLRTGRIRLAEIHWYEAHGLGRYEYKIKRYLD